MCEIAVQSPHLSSPLSPALSPAEETPEVNPRAILPCNPRPHHFVVSVGQSMDMFAPPDQVIVTRPMHPSIIGYARYEVENSSIHLLGAPGHARVIGRNSIAVRLTPCTEMEICTDDAPIMTHGVSWSEQGWVSYGGIRGEPGRGNVWLRRGFYTGDIE